MFSVLNFNHLIDFLFWMIYGGLFSSDQCMVSSYFMNTVSILILLRILFIMYLKFSLLLLCFCLYGFEQRFFFIFLF